MFSRPLVTRAPRRILPSDEHATQAYQSARSKNPVEDLVARAPQWVRTPSRKNNAAVHREYRRLTWSGGRLPRWVLPAPHAGNCTWLVKAIKCRSTPLVFLSNWSAEEPDPPERLQIALNDLVKSVFLNHLDQGLGATGTKKSHEFQRNDSEYTNRARK